MDNFLRFFFSYLIELNAYLSFLCSILTFFPPYYSLSSTNSTQTSAPYRVPESNAASSPHVSTSFALRTNISSPGPCSDLRSNSCSVSGSPSKPSSELCTPASSLSTTPLSAPVSVPLTATVRASAPLASSRRQMSVGEAPSNLLHERPMRSISDPARVFEGRSVMPFQCMSPMSEQSSLQPVLPFEPLTSVCIFFNLSIYLAIYLYAYVHVRTRLYQPIRIAGNYFHIAYK